MKTKGSFLLKIQQHIKNNASISCKKIKNKQKRINFKFKKKLNLVQIQNNEILVICQYWQAKLQ